MLQATLADQSRGLVEHGEALAWPCSIKWADGALLSVLLELLPPSPDQTVHHILLKRPKPGTGRPREGLGARARAATVRRAPSQTRIGTSSLPGRTSRRWSVISRSRPGRPKSLLAAGERVRLALSTRLADAARASRWS